MPCEATDGNPTPLFRLPKPCAYPVPTDSSKAFFGAARRVPMLGFSAPSEYDDVEGGSPSACCA